MKLKDSVVLILSVVLAIVVGVFVGVKITENRKETEEINFIEIGKQKFIEYLQENGAIDYKINSVGLSIQCADEFMLSINYNVKVAASYDSIFGQGNGYFEGDWVNYKSNFVLFRFENGGYKIIETYTGVDFPLNCKNGSVQSNA